MADKLRPVRDYALANKRALLIGMVCGLLVGCVF
jgi:hypothetical protein